MAVIRIRITTPDGEVIRRVDRRLVIGRAPDADVVIDDERVSRHHATIEPDGDLLLVTDLGSSNGTIVDRRRIEQHTAPGRHAPAAPCEDTPKERDDAHTAPVATATHQQPGVVDDRCMGKRKNNRYNNHTATGTSPANGRTPGAMPRIGGSPVPGNEPDDFGDIILTGTAV